MPRLNDTESLARGPLPLSEQFDSVETGLRSRPGPVTRQGHSGRFARDSSPDGPGRGKLSDATRCASGDCRE